MRYFSADLCLNYLREIPPYFSEVCAVSLRGSMIYCKSSKKSSEK